MSTENDKIENEGFDANEPDPVVEEYVPPVAAKNNKAKTFDEEVLKFNGDMVEVKNVADGLEIFVKVMTSADSFRRFKFKFNSQNEISMLFVPIMKGLNAYREESKRRGR